MHVINTLNVRDGLLQGVGYLWHYGVEEPTRLGNAMVSQGPVTIRYLRPKQHVLVNPDRDANPFFHLMEAMWMLAGREDGAFLDHYVSYFSKSFAKDGIVLDAYGHRWRYGYRYNQLDELVNQIRKEPSTRQAVLQMWGAGRDDLRAYSSKPCNLSAVFRIQGNRLNMTVYNRSNDLIWGCCGANAVHFPILQEYLASRVGVEVGEYWQVTNNLHLYEQHYDMADKLASAQLIDSSNYEREIVPLVSNPKAFDKELLDVMSFIDKIHENDLRIFDEQITNKFLSGTVLRMAITHHLHKQGAKTHALDIVETVEAEDWRRAGKEWLERRYAK